MAILIPTDVNLPQRDVLPKNDTDFQLAELCKLLTCSMIEIRQLSDGRIMVFDEEGKLAQKPRNQRATRLASFITPKQLIADMLRMHEAGIDAIWLGEPFTDMTTEIDFIAGDALLCSAHELK